MTSFICQHFSALGDDRLLLCKNQEHFNLGVQLKAPQENNIVKKAVLIEWLVKEIS
jgi:hypothetical protein